MERLAAAAPLLPADTHYTVKPHPACPVNSNDYPALKMHVTAAPLPELLPDCDIAYTSNITSAAVDAFCAGVPVISAMEGEALNMSPLRGMENVVFISNPIQLTDALSKVCDRERMLVAPYFFLDKELPRWRKLLNLGLAEAEQRAILSSDIAALFPKPNRQVKRSRELTP